MRKPWSLACFLITGMAFTQNLVGMEALHHHAAQGDVKKISELITQGIDINARDKEGRSALHLIIENWPEDIFFAFFSFEGIDVNARDNMGRTPSHIAALQGKSCTLSALKQGGADIWALDSYGLSPLHYAVMKGRDTVVEEILRITRSEALQRFSEPKL